MAHKFTINGVRFDVAPHLANTPLSEYIRTQTHYKVRLVLQGLKASASSLPLCATTMTGARVGRRACTLVVAREAVGLA